MTFDDTTASSSTQQTYPGSTRTPADSDPESSANNTTKNPTWTDALKEFRPQNWLAPTATTAAAFTASTFFPQTRSYLAPVALAALGTRLGYNLCRTAMSYAASSRVAEVFSADDTTPTANEEAREAERAASEAAKASFADANSRLKSILSTSAHWATFTSLYTAGLPASLAIAGGAMSELTTDGTLSYAARRVDDLKRIHKEASAKVYAVHPELWDDVWDKTTSAWSAFSERVVNLFTMPGEKDYAPPGCTAENRCTEVSDAVAARMEAEREEKMRRIREEKQTEEARDAVAKHKGDAMSRKLLTAKSSTRDHP